MAVQRASEKIDVVVGRWPGVTVAPHRFGGVEWRLGDRQIGRIHDDCLVEIPFPKKLRDELVAAQQVEPHQMLPESGWVSLRLKTEEDLKWAVLLLRRSFELAQQQLARRGSDTGDSPYAPSPFVEAKEESEFLAEVA